MIPELKKHTPILAVAGIVLAGGGFFGGMHYQRSLGSVRGQFAAGGMMQGGFAPGGRTGVGTQGGRTGRGGMMQGGFLGGTVLSVGDGTFTVKLRDGGSRVVLFPSKAEVQKSVAGAATDVVSGAQVTVSGTPNSDGSMTASLVQVRSESAAAGVPGGMMPIKGGTVPPTDGTVPNNK